ncbi:MAG: MBOAT family protein [Planctomycetes bacterium]|nr:MBOAT family protein [Planctomycetota bacterium]
MGFASREFLSFFLPPVLGTLLLLPRRATRIRTAAILAASIAFYAWLSLPFLALLAALVLINFAAARLIATRIRMRSRWLAISIAIDLAVLAASKCVAGFGAAAGISFYTFKILSHLIDVHRGGAPARSLLDWAAYVAFFPQIVCGPIQRFGTIDAKGEAVPSFADQLAGSAPRASLGTAGLALFILGFAKKVLLADPLGRAADAAFAAAAPGSLDLWFATAAYSFQLYFDFAGYSDMAIGIGRMIGIDCPRNFDAPYRAPGFTAFWRRWHISLSGWLRDYLYIPLGGSRAGAARTYLNLIIVFLLCGLWHGVRWTFVAWGAYHGAILVIERMRGRRTLYEGLPAPLRTAITFVLLTIGWVFFRASSLAEAGGWLAIMFSGSAPHGGSILLGGILYARGPLILLALCAALAFQPVQAIDWAKKLTWTRAVILAMLLFGSVATMWAQSFRAFLYEQF